MVIIMLSLNKKLKQIQTSIKREVYSASGRNTSLSYNTQNHMNIIVYKKLTFYTFVSSPVTESIINPLTIISSGINGCSIIARMRQDYEAALKTLDSIPPEVIRFYENRTQEPAMRHDK